MNVFVIGENKCPYRSAREQCDKHVVKMPTESAQMLSTAHRILDGELKPRPSVSGKRIVKYWELPDEREDILYKAVHPAHPCTVWTMESDANYRWHVEHFYALCEEYELRYERVHGAKKLLPVLQNLPNNTPKGSLTQFPLAMKSNPECMFPDDPVKSYRMFYHTKQERFKMTWKHGRVPDWFHAA